MEEKTKFFCYSIIFFPNLKAQETKTKETPKKDQNFNFFFLPDSIINAITFVPGLALKCFINALAEITSNHKLCDN